METRKVIFLVTALAAFLSCEIGTRAQRASAETACGIVDRVAFDRASTANGRALVSYTWHIGERAIPMTGARIVSGGKPLVFTLNTRGQSDGLTLALREFRAQNNGGIAYLVTVNGRKIAFRNSPFADAGPSTGFIDVPSGLAHSGKLMVRLTNVAGSPVQISEVLLYANLEAYARRAGMLQPLTFYLTSGLDPAKVRAWRAAWTDRPDVQIGLCYPTFPIAQWPPEKQKAELDRIIAFGRQTRLPLEVDPVSWWGGTPNGCDGLGGHWTDVTYQQVTYSPSLNRYGLSIPNRWSNTPWLTMGNSRLNAFKAEGLQTFGALIREAYARNTGGFPIHSIVIDNEPTYWVSGNPGGSPFSEWATPDAVADFNPAMRAAARRQGITLNPRGGLHDAQKQFLGRVLTAYDHQMHHALDKGMGGIPPADHVYTHSFETVCNGIFQTVIQGVGAGVLRQSRLGIEGGIAQNDFDQFREVGVPAAINVEFGGGSSAGPIVQAAYAAGCDHVTLFNASDAAVRNVRASLAHGWQEYRPQPWRRALTTSSLSHWLAMATVDPNVISESGGKLSGVTLGQDNRLLLRLDSRKLTGKPQFGPLILRYSGRAFVFQHDNPNGFLAVRVGAARDSLHEVSRIFNTGGETRTIDVTALAKNAREIWVEFDFHPLGLTDWVNLFDFRLERPWPFEKLMATNRSYKADRLRAESALVGWRADADWSLRLGAALPPAQLTAQDRADMRQARTLFAAGSYAKANNAARRVVRRHRPAAAPPPAGWAVRPAPNREETGEMAQTGAGTLTFNPYRPGFTGRSLPVSPQAQITLTENALPARTAALGDLRPGDDVQIQVRGGAAKSIRASRADAQARIVGLTSATPFALPIITLEGQPPRSAGRGVVKDRDGKPWVYQVGALPLAQGELVQACWNPRTGRLLDVRPEGEALRPQKVPALKPSGSASAGPGYE